MGFFFQEVLLLLTGSINKKEYFSNRCFYSERSSIRDKRVCIDKSFRNITSGMIYISLQIVIMLWECHFLVNVKKPIVEYYFKQKE